MRTDYDKLYKEIRRDSLNKVNASLREKERKENFKPRDTYDINLFNKGVDWYTNGNLLDDAPSEFKNNTNFINGFNKAKRLDDINRLIYTDGQKFFLAGYGMEEAPEKMRVNTYFIQGFEDAQNIAKKRIK